MAWTGSPATPGYARPGSPEDQAIRQRQLAQQHQALSGVNPGGGGYVSGQVAPAGAAARPQPAAPRPPAAAPPAPLPAVAPVAPAAAFGVPAGINGIASSVGAAQTPGGFQAVANGHRAGSASTVPGSTGSNGAGTSNTEILPGTNSVPIVGGLLGTSTADLSGVHAAQNADFGAAQSLNQERYDYRPGESPYQERVQLDTTNADQTRAQQEQALTALTSAANGTVPSAAELQLRQQSDHNNASAFGAAQALRGRSPGGSYLQASRQGAASQLATNAQAAQLRAAEQERARGQLMEALTGVRTQDVGTASANANLGQAANANNLQAQTQANAQAQDWRQQLLQGQLAAMGYGTQAATGGANAAAANAKAENEGKNKFINAAASFL